MPASLLGDWSNFYVITGSSAAGLTGLTFVVIALAADTNRVVLTGVQAFVTPTIVHFSAVLLIATFMCMPHQSPLSLGVGFGVGGAAGLMFCAVVARRMHQMKSYVPVAEDWIWSVILPTLAYLMLFAVGLCISRYVLACTYVSAAASLGLLFIAIHNAWDNAVWLSANRTEKSP